MNDIRKRVLVPLVFFALFALIISLLGLVYNKQITGYQIFGTGWGVSNTMTIRNDDSFTFTNYPVQFGRAFVKGEIPSGNRPQVLINGAQIPTQADIKNYWDDGSVKFAVISFVVPSLNSGQQATLTFQSISEAQYQSSIGTNAISTTDMLNNYDFDAQIELTVPGLTAHTISARNILQNGHIDKTWLSGPIVTSVVLADHGVTKTYDYGAQQQGTTLTRCVSFSNTGCSASNILEVADASWLAALPAGGIGQVLNLQDELVQVQAVNTVGQDTITVLRDFGGLPHLPTIDLGYFVTSNTWQTTTLANRKSFRPVFIADFWGAPVNKVRVRMIGENTNTEALQDLNYGLVLKTGFANPTPVYSESDVTHHIGAVWSKQFWLTPVSQKLSKDYNKNYLAQTGFIDYYDPAVQASSTVVSNWYNCYVSGTTCGPLSLNNGGNGLFERSIHVYTAMGPGGGRWELGPIQQTNALWINNPDWRMEYVALAMADTAGSWPIHFRENDANKVYNRDPNTGAVYAISNPLAVPALGKPISVNSRPTLAVSAPLWTYTTASDKLNLVSRFTEGEANNPLWFDGSRQQWAVSMGHYYGNFPYQPYIFTGDYYYYNDLDFWTSYSTLGDSNHRGPVPGAGAGQAMALTSPWGSRYQFRPFYSRAHMATVAVDGSPEKAHYTNSVLDALIAWMGMQNIPLSQEPTIPQTPGVNTWNINMWNFGRNQWTNPGNAFGNPDLPSPLNFWIYGSGCGSYPVVTGTNQPDFCEASWMMATGAESLNFAHRLGYPAGSLMSFMSDFYDWHFTTQGFDPKYLGAYRHPTTDTNSVPLTTPQQVESYFDPVYQSNSCLQSGLPSFCAISNGENYLSYHTSASARLYGFDQAAYTWLRNSAGVVNAYASGVYTADPRYAVAPSPNAISCNANQFYSCSTGFSGVCNVGQHQCNSAGNGFGACTPNINPGTVTETCDNIDNNCDGQVDEGCDCQDWFGGQTCSSGQICYGGSYISQAAQANCCASPGVCQAFVIPTGLVAGYPFGEGSGIATYDASGNNNHGALINGPVWSSGKYDNALTFDAFNDHISVPDSSSLNPTNALTLTAWIYDPVNGGIIVGKGDLGNQYHLRLTGGGAIRFRLNGDLPNSGQVERTVTLGTGWHHVAGVYDGSYLKVYYDGVQQGASVPYSASISVSNYPLVIGARINSLNALSNVYDGAIDEVRIYNVGLTDSEVVSDMNTPLFVNSPPSPPSGLTAS